MRLDSRALGIAAGGATAAAFAICALFVAIAPGATTAFFSFVLHYDLSGLTRPLTWGSFVGGLVIVAGGVAVFFTLIGWLYNRMIGARLGKGAGNSPTGAA